MELHTLTLAARSYALLVLALNHDLIQSLTDSWYLALSAGVDVPLGAVDGPTLSLGASVAASGDADAYGGKNGFNDLTLTASVVRVRVWIKEQRKPLLAILDISRL